jgi:hypothetical protein
MTETCCGNNIRGGEEQLFEFLPEDGDSMHLINGIESRPDELNFSMYLSV